MKPLLFTVVWCLACTPLFAFGLTGNLSPDAMALGGNNLSSPDFYHSNPSLSNSDSIAFGCFAANQYGVKELFTYQANCFFLTKYGKFGLITKHYGYDVFNESNLGFSYQYFIHNRFSLNSELQLYLLQTGVTYAAAPILNIGFSAQPWNRLTLAFQVRNISFSTIHANGNRYALPVIFELGAHYKFNRQLWAITAFEKDLYAPFRFNAGLQYTVHGFDIRIGVNVLKRMSPAFGFGYHSEHWRFDIGFLYDLYLGLQSSVGIRYCLR
ncbi:MAG: hypothetical protein J5808_04050 [Paludibacteraceae bacterium]|nr:hypothetical protein [Paludibacteraceae bacterium]